MQVRANQRKRLDRLQGDLQAARAEAMEELTAHGAMTKGE